MTDLPEIAWHYCPLSSLYGIVRSQRFRLTNVQFMNDALELDWFKQIVQTVSAQEHAIDFAHTDFKLELANRLVHREFDHIYCGCFSEEEDDLSQWRGYADDARGVSIGVELPTVHDEAPALRVTRVDYGDSSPEELATELLREYDKEKGTELLYSMIRMHAPKFKNPAFRHEREIRLVADDHRTENVDRKMNYNETLTMALPSEIDFYLRDGCLVPFVTIPLPLAAIRTVYVGPRFGGNYEESALRLFLSKQLYDNDLAHHEIEVRRSEASYR